VQYSDHRFDKPQHLELSCQIDMLKNLLPAGMVLIKTRKSCLAQLLQDVIYAIPMVEWCRFNESFKDL
jgi:hypothetical protein